jgi:hypothetical protein
MLNNKYVMSKKIKSSYVQLLTVSRFSMPDFVLSSGATEALKWIAVVIMTIDHVNRYVLHGSVTYMFALGRLAMPIFAFTLAYQLARNDAFSNGVHFRVIRRLVFFAVISSIPYVVLNKLTLIQGWWPLNILFLLLIGTGLVALLESTFIYRNSLAFLLFIFGGAIVEFWWAGLAVFFFSWRYIKSPNLVDFSGLLIALFLLGNINGNQWALASVPVVFVMSNIEVNIPRIKHILYFYYPLHLALIWLFTSFQSFM